MDFMVEEGKFSILDYQMTGEINPPFVNDLPLTEFQTAQEIYQSNKRTLNYTMSQRMIYDLIITFEREIGLKKLLKEMGSTFLKKDQIAVIWENPFLDLLVDVKKISESESSEEKSSGSYDSPTNQKGLPNVETP